MHVSGETQEALQVNTADLLSTSRMNFRIADRHDKQGFLATSLPTVNAAGLQGLLRDLQTVQGLQVKSELQPIGDLSAGNHELQHEDCQSLQV